MIDPGEIKKYQQAQAIARKTISEISKTIRPGMTKEDISESAKEVMLSIGATGFWYYNIPAIVFIGKDTVLYSKEHINTAKERVMEKDILWIDLSPQIGNYWGDYTRTLILNEGKVIRKKDYSNLEDHKSCKDFVKLAIDIELIQNKIIQVIHPEMNFSELTELTIDTINELGYINVDTRNNFGHTIVKDIKARSFIVEESKIKLKDVLFAFEVQIGKKGLDYSARIEDVFYFNGNNKLIKL